MRSRRWKTLLVAFVLAIVAPAGSAAAPFVRGVDVSHWNGPIAWTSVAASGVQFAFAKATDGVGGADLTYGTSAAGAEAAGLYLGAYHFARPAGRTAAAVVANARAQADHFVAVARLGPLELLPVLDLEKTGGLRRGQLVRWTSAWLSEVRRLLHVNPIVYCSPYFWRVALGDTTAIARGGYRFLWIARWTRAASPALPAARWGGFGCVDEDRYGGSDLGDVTLGAAPTPTDAPTLAGTPAVGQTLTATSGDWQGVEPLDYSYEWDRCDPTGATCAAIEGASRGTYTVAAADAGSTLRVSVRASNAVGFGAAQSPPTPVVG